MAHKAIGFLHALFLMEFVCMVELIKTGPECPSERIKIFSLC